MAVSKRAHFTPELFKFLRQLKRNNDREWFSANKGRYIEHVRDPLLAFIEDFAPKLKSISRQLVADPAPVGGSMFRIHRDVRFGTDKSPYKTAASAQFRHVKGKSVHCPGYYLHLGIGEVFIGSGIWRPDSTTAMKIREAITEDTPRWKRLMNSKPFKEGILAMSGDSLKRPPRGLPGVDVDHPFIDDLKRKDFITVTMLDEKAACAPDFLDHVTKTCRAAKPIMQFIADGMGMTF